MCVYNFIMIYLQVVVIFIFYYSIVVVYLCTFTALYVLFHGDTLAVVGRKASIHE